MKKFVSAFLFCAIVLFTAACASTQSNEPQSPKYVFLFIGDGMGKPHVELARSTFGKLNMDKLPVRGSVCTVNVDKGITDSAASGTALACGMKTQNGHLGTAPDGKNIYSSALLAKQQGRRVAILTTVGVNNATPAAFYAHVQKRSESKKIMEQFPASGFDILAGTGIDGMKKDVKQEDFLTGEAYRKGGVQGSADSLNGKGVYVIAKDDAPFFAIKQLNCPVLVYSKGADNLAAYVQKSIDLMQDCPKGFFMMAEGGHIDHGGHGNNGQYMLDELRKFDLAVSTALRFYEKHPNETLIVVTADHHTGGLTLNGKVNPAYADMTMAGLKITGKTELKEILRKLEAKGIKCTEPELADLKKASEHKHRAAALEQSLRRIVDAHSGISWKTHGHTLDDVFLFAIGTGAEKFAGQQHNSDVGRKMKEILAAGK